MNTDRIVDNLTPMTARCVPMDDRHGREVLVVIAKMSWSVSRVGAVSPAVPAARVRFGDDHVAGTGSSVRRPSDLVDEKPGTDVLLVGTAYPPPGGAAREVEVRLRVAGGDRMLIDKVVVVHGPRVWTQGAVRVTPGPAGVMTKTPLQWELAYGGRDDECDPPAYDVRNPIGSGFAVDRATLVDRPAPHLEDPRAPAASRKPAPACFGPLEPHWAPRATRAGTHDADWSKYRSPLRPEDFDPRFNCCAPDDQWCAEALRGDETIEVLNATPEGSWRFQLPHYEPRFQARVEGVELSGETHLDTLLVDADERLVELTWRTSFALPRKSERLEWVRIHEAQPLADEHLASLAEKLAAREAAPA